MKKIGMLCVIGLLLVACAAEQQEATLVIEPTDADVASDEGVWEIQVDDLAWEVEEEANFEWLEQQPEEEAIVLQTEQIEALWIQATKKLKSYDALNSFVIREIYYRDEADPIQLLSDTAFLFDGAATGDFSVSRARFLQDIDVRGYDIERQGYYDRNEEYSYEYTNMSERWQMISPMEEPFMYYTPLQWMTKLQPLMAQMEGEQIGDERMISVFLNPTEQKALIEQLTMYGIERDMPLVDDMRSTLFTSEWMDTAQMAVILLFDESTSTLKHVMFEHIVSEFGELIDDANEWAYPWRARFSQQYYYEGTVPLENLEITDDIRAQAAAG